MGASEGNRAAADLAAKAAAQVRRAVLEAVRDAGGEIIRRPVFRGDPRSGTAPDAEPAAGLGAARAIELQARRAARGYVRDAREAGYTWQQIGAAMGLVPGGEPDLAGDMIGEAAYSYAAGHPGTETARRYGLSFSWTCRSCDRQISDHGLCGGPAEDERGHAGDCSRLAAATAAWDAEWAGFDAEWEAGQ